MANTRQTVVIHNFSAISTSTELEHFGVPRSAWFPRQRGRRRIPNVTSCAKRYSLQSESRRGVADREVATSNAEAQHRYPRRMPFLRQARDGLELDVTVQPRASCTELMGEHGQRLKVRVAAPPVDGAANDVLIAFIAEQLSVPRSNVSVLRGYAGRRKTLRILGSALEVARDRLLGG